jgi:hypothetical protein
MVTMPKTNDFRDTTALCSVLADASYQLEMRVRGFRDVEGPQLREWALLVEEARAPEAGMLSVLANRKVWLAAMDRHQPEANAEDKPALVDAMQVEMVSYKTYSVRNPLDAEKAKAVLGYMAALRDQLVKGAATKAHGLLER